MYKAERDKLAHGANVERILRERYVLGFSLHKIEIKFVNLLLLCTIVFVLCSLC